MNAVVYTPWTGTVLDGAVRIPTLEEMMKFCTAHRQRLFIDVKPSHNGGSNIDSILELMDLYAPDAIIGFINTFVDTSGYNYIRARKKHIALWSYFNGDIADAREFAQQGGELYMGAEYTVYTNNPSLVEAMRLEGVQPIADGLGKQRTADQLFDIGIDCIMTDGLIHGDLR